MNKVALIAPFGWAGVSTPLILTIEYLTSINYSIDLYLDYNKYCDDIGINQPLFNFKNTTIFYYEVKGEEKKIEHNQLLIPQQDLHFINFFDKNKQDYAFIIGYDERGVIRTGLCAQKYKIPYVYFSLEFYEKQNHIKKAEKYFAQKASKIITQDPFRAKILTKCLNVPADNISFIYNTTIGEPIKIKSNYLKNKFKINSNKKIILAIGTLLEITGITDLLESLPLLDEHFVLVLHGWIPNSKMQETINSYIQQYPEKIFYSDEKLSHDEKFKIYSSADIGFIHYSPQNLNLKYAAWSSGKFFDFIRCGVPVVANMIPNMKKLVEKNGVGKVINKYEYINDELNTLLNHYDKYSSNCYITYKKYSYITSFNNSLNSLLTTKGFIHE